MQEEFEKMQQALNRSYADRDKIVSDLDKLREDLERSQVRFLAYLFFYQFFRFLSQNLLFSSFLPRAKNKGYGWEIPVATGEDPASVGQSAVRL